jgi:insertion element IS1 protein InsB
VHFAAVRSFRSSAFRRAAPAVAPEDIYPRFRPYWGAYTRQLDADAHNPGKRHTQKIERKHLTLRTRIKRLTRKTICFSRSIEMHDLVIGLFVNRYEFGLPV